MAARQHRRDLRFGQVGRDRFSHPQFQPLNESITVRGTAPRRMLHQADIEANRSLDSVCAAAALVGPAGAGEQFRRRPASCPPARPAARPTGQCAAAASAGSWGVAEQSAAAQRRRGRPSRHRFHLTPLRSTPRPRPPATSCRCAVNAIRTMSGSHWWRSIIGAKSRRSTGSNRRRASSQTSPLLRGQRQRRQAEVTALPLRGVGGGVCLRGVEVPRASSWSVPGAPRSVRRLRAAAAPPHPVPWRHRT